LAIDEVADELVAKEDAIDSTLLIETEPLQTVLPPETETTESVTENSEEVAQNEPLLAVDEVADELVAKEDAIDSTLLIETDDINNVTDTRIESNTIKNSEAFNYRIQIAAARSKESNANLKNIYKGDKTINSFEEDGYFKYYIDETPSYKDAKKILKESGVKSAFIVAYRGDVKWKLQEAISLQAKNALLQKTETSSDQLSEAKKELEEKLITATPSNNNEIDDFQYRVQIAAARTKESDAHLKDIYKGDKTIRVFEEEGYFKYYIIETPSYFVAKKVLKESDVKQAFIVAYKNEVKWKIEDALALQYIPPIVNGALEKNDSLHKIVTTNFEFDAFTLSSSEKLHLQKFVIDPLKSNTSSYAIVNGFTDIRGSDVYNYGLSQERALSVKQFILNQGIDAQRVTTQFFGESQVIKYCPEDENCDEKIHQVNRRVEILLLTPKK
ncbi:MAG: OmpA family protein, partial [Cyclobacteriaceae bacterium]|nr:OmpA family protein [Cyclobacteriaceae bacterium]